MTKICNVGAAFLTACALTPAAAGAERLLPSPSPLGGNHPSLVVDGKGAPWMVDVRTDVEVPGTVRVGGTSLQRSFRTMAKSRVTSTAASAGVAGVAAVWPEVVKPAGAIQRARVRIVTCTARACATPRTVWATRRRTVDPAPAVARVGRTYLVVFATQRCLRLAAIAPGQAVGRSSCVSAAATGPQIVAVDARTAVIAWGGSDGVYASTWTSGRGVSSPQRLGATGSDLRAVARAGTTVVAWRSGRPRGSGPPTIAVRPTGASAFGSSRTVSTAKTRQLSVALTDAGRIAIGAEIVGADPALPRRALPAVLTGSLDGPFTSPRLLQTTDPADPVAVTASANALTAVWLAPDDDLPHGQSTQGIAPGGAHVEVIDIAEDGSVATAAIGTSPTGRTPLAAFGGNHTVIAWNALAGGYRFRST